MEPFASPIQIPVARDCVLDAWLVAAHLCTFGIVIWIFPPGLHSTVIALAVAASLLNLKRSAAQLRARASAVLLGADEHWSLVTATGEVRPAQLLSGVFVSPALVIMRLKPIGGSPLHIVLTRSNTPPQTLRRLRVRLRLPMHAHTPITTGS